ncbi:capsid protein [Cohnella sp. GbtcB17]|uniref:capsid protein n=1 Tax=Cohnella sp. GbtcB17 TaxID=2824762 RepID=UPI001C30D5D2|nr:capsid protein [Cohnella sp. GbtcB17]
MGVWTGVKNALMKMLRIQPAPDNRAITIKEPMSYQTNVLRNRLWYRGDPSELDQFYKATQWDAVSRTRFWAAVPTDGLGIRKIHSGLPALMADRLADIVVADLDSIELGNEAQTTTWDEIAEDNDISELLGDAIAQTLATGDGAFKLSVDTALTQYPIIEFYAADQVEYKRERGRLQEIIFYSDYVANDKEYRLEETYGKGYIKYRLLTSDGKEVPLSTVTELAELQDTTYAGEFLMGVPLMFFKSPKWKGRGKSLFDGGKADNFDALDEVISQWMDAIRAGRVQKYIPEDLVPRNPDTGELLRSNPFDNQFIKVGSSLAEDEKSQISMVQPQILYEAFVESYASALDMCLQGIMSPATLGIDLKKTDNAEAQREKEKATLYTRGKIVDRLNEVIPELVSVALRVWDTMQTKTPGDYEASVSFGEYAAPDFGSVVEIVGKARAYGVMSIETSVDEMYGDTWTDEEKAEEIARLKAEQAGAAATEPAINRDSPPGDDVE